MSTHTKGPWRLSDNKQWIQGEWDTDIACICNAHYWGQPQADANARLITAAPELLDACREAESVLRTFAEANTAVAPRTLEKLRAALAKAEGR